MDLVNLSAGLLQSGLRNLAAYLAAHVLLCLVPAFTIAGAMSALIPKESVTRFLGRNAPKLVSYPAAALAGSLLAVCSCTIVPLFAGIYKKGAGLGPAITFLFFAPAANILALVYTGSLIGPDLAFARLALSLAFGIGIGLIMALLFRRADLAHHQSAEELFAGGRKMQRAGQAFLLVLVVLLLAGTFKIDLLSSAYAQLNVPLTGGDGFQNSLDRLVPYDPVKGEEGLTTQGVVLIGLLALLGLSAYRGLEGILEKSNYWTWVALSLGGLTLLFAALGITDQPDRLVIQFTGRFFSVFLALIVLFLLGRFALEPQALRTWLWETWRFVKQIFPLLIAGVFLVGVIRQLIRPEWIEGLAGQNTLLGNFAGVLFGVFMYFPTLVEVPIARMFLSLGMHRGPLLAYLMADPELSLQSILIISAILGRLKAWTYVGWVALFSALAGWIYGSWVDGTSLTQIGLYLAGFLTLLTAGLAWVTRRTHTTLTPAEGN